MKPSYAEKYIIELLREEFNSLNYIRELKVGKWFIDFAFENLKIALEIDGKQHNLPERKISDALKDDFLVSQGWVVHRVKWKKISKEFREELIKKIKEISESR